MLLGACSSGRGATGSSENAGAVVDHDQPGPLESQRFTTDPHRSGQASELNVVNIFWGRLVDVYDESAQGEHVLQHKDYVIGSDIESDGLDFLISTDPLTGTQELVILHPFGGDDGVPSAGDAYGRAFERLELNLRIVPASSYGVLSMVPRNAAIIVQFNDLLDESLVTQSTLRVMCGYPPTTQAETRTFIDRNYGAHLIRNGDTSFHSTRIIIDPVVSELDAFLHDPPLAINGIGLPPSLNVEHVNLAIRIPAREAALIGQVIILRNLSGHALGTNGVVGIDQASETMDYLREARSGGPSDMTGDPGNGFLPDDVAPRLVGGQPIQILEPPVPDASGTDADFILPRLRFHSDVCARDLRRGDVIRQPGFFARVRADALMGASEVSSVKVRLLGGDPADWMLAAVGEAQILTPFDAVLDADRGACFLWITPTPAGWPHDPQLGLSPMSIMTLRFSEAMDPTSITAFDSFMLTRRAEPISSDDYVVGSIQSSPDAQAFSFIPSLPLKHVVGTQESYWVQLVDGVRGPHDLAGNPLADDMDPVGVLLAADAVSQSTGGKVYRYVSDDEEAPFGDEFGAMPEWTGQHLHDFARGRILPRPVIRYQAVADRTQAIPMMMTSFAQGVQTPLSSLGSRMQTLWRYCDVGLSLTDATGYNVDVEGMSWAPANGQIIADHFALFEIGLATSNYLPDEILNGALLPNYPNSGLRGTYDQNLLDPENDPLRVVHPRERGYTVSPSDLYATSTGTLMMPFPMNRGVAADEVRTYTWRDTGLTARGAPNGAGVELSPNFVTLGIGTPGLMTAGHVETIGLPLLMDFRCYPDDGALGLNALDISLAVNSSARPNFRAFTTGGVDHSLSTIIVNPDLETMANGGFNPTSNPPGAVTAGLDNSFYIGALDLVTRISRSYSVWLEASEVAGVTHFAPAVLEPQLADQPQGTRIDLAYRGATAIMAGTVDVVTGNASSFDSYGDYYIAPDVNRDEANIGITLLGDGDWSADVADIDGARYIQIRVTFVSSIETGLTPTLSAIGLAWGN